MPGVSTYSAVQISGATSLGILGFISNHSFLDNPTFRGMRANLMASFPLVHLLDLHGNIGKRERGPEDAIDENVFDIQQGVSIGLFRHRPEPNNSRVVGHAHLWGLRGADWKTESGGKYGWLLRSSYASTDWVQLSPDAPFYLFVPQDIDMRREYNAYWKLTDVMPHYGAGIITSRDHFVIDFEDAPLLKRLDQFRDNAIPDEWVRAHLGVKDNSMWRMAEARREFRKHPIREELFVDLLYRPFDRRRIYFETNVVFNMRIQVMRHMLAGPNLGLLTARSNKSPTPDHFFCSKLIVETKCGESTTQSSFFPLFLFPSDRELSLRTGRQANLSPAFLAVANYMFTGNRESTANAEDIFHYAYAVFHSLGYRSRYAAFLKIDFPRLPLTGNLELFHALASHGGELTSLHLMESPRLAQPITEFIGDRRSEVKKISWSKNTVWVDKEQTTGFKGVREAVWNFHIGGYQVCEKWLKDRKGRKLSKDDITHYQKIVVALAETIRLMQAIDKVIEKHGGWPGAFASSTPAISSSTAVGEASPDNVIPIRGDASGQAELYEHAAVPLRKAAEPSVPAYVGKGAASAEGETDFGPEELDREELICQTRQLFIDGVAREREAAIGELARELGYKRTGTRIHEVLDDTIRTTVRRGILENAGGALKIGAKSIEHYERAFLKEQFLASLGGTTWIEREEAIRGLARWLGFRRTGPSIDETGRSLINGLIRDGRLEASGSEIRRS